MFDAADRNGDGKLTREEFERYLDVQQELSDLGLSLTAPKIVVNRQDECLVEFRLGQSRVGYLVARKLSDKVVWEVPAAAPPKPAAAHSHSSG